MDSSCCGLADSNNYHDSDTLRPRGGALTDEGVILFGGTAISISSDGYTYSYSLEENILTPLSPGLPVYRHRTRISDAPVCGAAEITGIKGKDAAARQPLCVISADGIRHITADGTGNYYASKLISRIPGLYPSPTPGVIPCGDSIVFLSPDGLGRLHLSGSVKIFNPGVIARNLMLLTPTYHPSALIVISDGNSYLADTAGESMRLQSADFTGIQPVYDGGTIAWATSDGTLLTPKVTETNCHADDSPSNPGSGVGLPPGYCRYLTRPLKLAGPFIRESIRGLEVVAEDAILSIEGSDNLIDWQEIVHGRTPLRGIYSPCFRFFRVSVIAPRSSSDFLHRLRIVTRLH